MTRSLVVQKYGGTSVGTLERIRHVAGHIHATVKSGKQVVAVVSAMGEQTDELLAMAHKISAHPPRRELDMLLTAGERISTALVSIALNELGMSAVSLTGSQSGIITDTTHGNARISNILGQRIETSLAGGSVVIVAGFQGVSHDTKEITTLGRGGTDLSAIALAGRLSAACQLYKDVDGVFSADPRIVPTARKLDQVSWDSMADMAWCGASIVHPRGAHVAEKYKIPVEIRSSFHLDRPGTFVTGKNAMEKYVVQAITHRNNMALVTGGLKGPDRESLNALRSWMWEQGETPQLQTQSIHGKGVTFGWSMPQHLVKGAGELLKGHGNFDGELSITPCGLITVIGGGFWQSPELIPSIQDVVKNASFIDVKNSAVMIAVSQDDVDRTLKALHKLLIET